MNRLPPTWAVAPIDDLVLETTQRLPADDESFRYVDIAAVDRESKIITSPQELLGAEAPSRARKEVRSGDVLVSMTRPNLNAVGRDEHQQVVSDGRAPPK